MAYLAASWRTGAGCENESPLTNSDHVAVYSLSRAVHWSRVAPSGLVRLTLVSQRICSPKTQHVWGGHCFGCVQVRRTPAATKPRFCKTISLKIMCLEALVFTKGTPVCCHSGQMLATSTNAPTLHCLAQFMRHLQCELYPYSLVRLLVAKC